MDQVPLGFGLRSQERQELVEVAAGSAFTGLHAFDPADQAALLQRSGNESEDERGEHGRNVRTFRLTAVAAAYRP